MTDPSGDEREDPAPVPDHPRVRPARSADRGVLLALQRELPRPNPDLLRGAVGGIGRVLVSTADGPPGGGGPVGYLLALGRAAAPDGPEDRRQADRDADASTGDETGAYVAELAVAPTHRREGRAVELLDALAADLDCGWITLTVAPDNDAALACYEAAGFRELRREPEFFDGEPALVLGRRVQD